MSRVLLPASQPFYDAAQACVAPYSERLAQR